jgi:hypothetical protein
LVLRGRVALISPLKAYKSLEGLDGWGSDGMNFSVSAPTVYPRIGETLCGIRSGCVTFRMAKDGFVRQLRNFDSCDLRRGVGEVITNEGRSDSDSLK